MTNDVRMDWDRSDRIGLEEAVFCRGKTVSQITKIIGEAKKIGRSLFLTHMDKSAWESLPTDIVKEMDYNDLSHTAVFGEPRARVSVGENLVAILTGGSSDAAVAAEVARTLEYHGVAARTFADSGVAGLWRLIDIIEDLRKFKILIAIAGMEGALFSVVGGLAPAVIIAVPSSNGYGVSKNGQAALISALASCAPGILTVNIDNGYGAACAAIRIIKAQASFGK